MVSLRSIAKALGGEVAGVNQVVVPAPGHSHRDRGLSVRFDPQAPGGILVHLFNGGDELAAKDWVRDRLGLSRRHDNLGGAAKISGAAPTVCLGTETNDLNRTTRARVLWEEARDPRGTIVERYLLQERGLHLPDEVAGTVLRFHPACPWKGDDGLTLRVPCMVAAMRAVDGDAITAVHRTRLTKDGRKVGRRMLGKASGSAIKLDADDAVCQGLIVGEGVETCLAARQIGLKPVWALGSVGSTGAFPILPGVDALTILAESDSTGANERAISQCGDRWNAAKRGVIVAAPKFGGDINDAIRIRRASHGL